jgi:hypothetical protein
MPSQVIITVQLKPSIDMKPKLRYKNLVWFEIVNICSTYLQYRLLPKASQRFIVAICNTLHSFTFNLNGILVIDNLHLIRLVHCDNTCGEDNPIGRVLVMREGTEQVWMGATSWLGMVW